jgi:hypothetical protein
MVDLLVRLYSLRPMGSLVEKLGSEGIVIRRAHPSETGIIVPWVCENFHEKWAAETRGAMENRPVTCFIATALLAVPEPSNDAYNLPPERLTGFACYDIIAKGMFGPEGVHTEYRERGIGKALLLACMHAMAIDGYAYAVISWAGPIEFYKNAVGATPIENSEPGIFRGPLVTE